MPPDKRKREDDDADHKAKRPRTRSTTKDHRDAEVAAERARIAQEKAELEKRRREALARQPKAVPGNRGDGQLHIAFIRVGQGDCAVVSTPAGRVLIFDCGSDSKEGEDDNNFKRRLRSVLKGPKFLKGTDTIDALILTHPDTDHYNQVEAALGNDFTVQSCYHSGKPEYYSQAQTSNWVQGRLVHKATGMKRVVNNHDLKHGASGEVTLNGVPVKPAAGDVTVDRLDGKGGILIVDEPSCKVSILAAGVDFSYTQDASNPTNRGSIVTLIEANNQRILMCGDGTVNTEKYLLNTMSDRLKDLTMVQIGHHGSINTSSSPAFVRKVNPLRAVASAGKKIPMHHLPSKEALTLYVGQMTTAKRPKVPEHELFYWAPGAMGSYNFESAFYELQVHTTGSDDTLELTYGPAQ